MAYHYHREPSRSESTHKDLIIQQLRAEISELSTRDTEYEEALYNLDEIERKIASAKTEKRVLEAQKNAYREEGYHTTAVLKNE
jgi:hypothetical protein